MLLNGDILYKFAFTPTFCSLQGVGRVQTEMKRVLCRNVRFDPKVVIV